MTSEPSSPVRLGTYELIRPLAQGGMADIYLARRAGIGSFERLVAVKILSAARALDPEACAMFLHEARVCALLNHQNIASVLDVDVIDGAHFLAMEYVHGVDLRELLAAATRANRTISYEAALSIVTAAGAGLDHAHRRRDNEGRPLRLVHRDVSLSNIMVGHDGGVKVVDFGIATTSIASVHTSPGVVRGKASYMSPEQCLGDELDHRTDVFALGIVLYELTTGARCFHGRSDFERMLAVVRSEYIAPSTLVADYPAELEQIIRKALAIDAAHRYESCAELIDALERVAMARGWVLGVTTIGRTMKELYGCVEAPCSTSELAVTPEQIVSCEPDIPPILRLDITACDTPSARQGIADAATQRSGVRLARGANQRLAHGTAAEDLLVQPPAPALDDDDDDAPTRGRRALKRPGSVAPIAA